MKKFLIGLGLLAVAGATVAGLVFFSYQKDLKTPKGDGAEKVFVVDTGLDAEGLGAKLEAEGLINSKWSFLAYVKLNGFSGSLKAGTYLVSPKKTIPELVKIFTEGSVATKKVTVPEGLTTKATGQKVAKADVVTEEDFKLALKKEDHEFEFIKSIPKNQGLEGYLFPDTYLFPYGSSAKEVVSAMLANFESKITPDISKGFSKEGLKLHQAVTLASIIELEASKDSDRKVIAGILLNRLSLGIMLQVDASINFITGKSDRAARASDLLIDSPYNTYKYKGLPPGPIASPGLSSILAVSDPTDSNYLFYCHDKAGKIYYGRNDSEHNQNRLKCL